MSQRRKDQQAGYAGTCVTLRVSRVKALTRTVAWSAPATVCALLSIGIARLLVGVYGRLGFATSGMSNRFVAYSLAICMIPIVCAGVVFLFLTLRWFLLAVWPGTLGIFGDDQGLLLRLGSFGTRRLESARLDVKYPFELEEDMAESSVEAFLPEEQQRATLLPRITYPDAAEPINHTILRFVGMMEHDAAAAIRPWVDSWQVRNATRRQQRSESQA